MHRVVSRKRTDGEERVALRRRRNSVVAAMALAAGLSMISAAIAEAQEATGETTAQVSVRSANFRAACSLGAKVVAGLTEGERVVVLGREGEWYHVRHPPNGVTGCMHQSVLTEPTPPVMQAESSEAATPTPPAEPSDHVSAEEPGRATSLEPRPEEDGASTDREWSLEMGLRYVYSTGKASKDVYLFPPYESVLVSRLIYDDLGANTGELFFNATYEPLGVFLKGFIGSGEIGQGELVDEDFPPVIDPYSNTLSAQDGGDITHATVDIGYYFWQRPRYRFGAFVGYNVWNESYDAFGCTQRVAVSTICRPSVPADINVISQDNDWRSLRLGLATQMQIAKRFSLVGDVAFLFTELDGEDRHHLREDREPTPEVGDGEGVQLEMGLRYQVTDRFLLGAGGRYWSVESEAGSPFDVPPGGPVPPGRTEQPIDWETERYGAYLQAGFTF